MKLIGLLQRGIRRHGLAGCLRRAWELLRQTLVRVPYMHERHLWYRLDLTRARQPIGLPTGLELVHARDADLSMLEQLETIGQLEARRRLATGVDLWIVREGTQAAFACWIFHDRAPVLAATGGWLDLPERTVCLEDSVTAAAYRGRGIAPAAWSQIAERLSREGSVAIITKIEEQNTASCKAVEKVGFQTVATMNLERVWLMPHVQVKPRSQDGLSLFLIEHLTR